MPNVKRIRTSAKEAPAQSKTATPPFIYWGADRTKCDGGKLPVYAGGMVWTVNAEPPSLAWIISAASALAGWDLLAAAKKRDAAVSRIDQIKHWRWRKAQAERNAQLPKEAQDPGLVGGLDDPYTAKRHEVEMQSAISAANDLGDGMEVNYWLHHALLESPEALLKATYKHLRVIHTLPRVYDPARVTPAIWADAKRDYQDILADAYAAFEAARQGLEDGQLHYEAMLADLASPAPSHEGKGQRETRKQGTDREISNGPDVPVTLLEFLQCYCKTNGLAKTIMESRARSLQSGARRGKIKLPSHAGNWKRGQSKKYHPSELKKSWSTYQAFNSGLPALK